MRNRTTSIYRQAERLADLTKTCIRNGNIPRAKKFFAVAEKRYRQGNNETKNAVINVFLVSVSCFMELQKCSIHHLFPASLKREYIRQVNASCI